MALFNKDPVALNKEWQNTLCRVIAQSSLDTFWNADDFNREEKESLRKMCEMSQALHTDLKESSGYTQDADDLNMLASKQHIAWFNHLAAVHNDIDFMKAAEIMDNLGTL